MAKEAIAAGGTWVSEFEIAFDGGAVLLHVYGNVNDCHSGYLCAFEDTQLNYYARNAVCSYRNVLNYYSYMGDEGQGSRCVDSMSSFYNRRSGGAYWRDSAGSGTYMFAQPNTAVFYVGNSFNDRADAYRIFG